MFPFGSGMRPTNVQQTPSAPPSVQANSQYSGQPIQMSQPFGSGMGFRPQISQATQVTHQVTNNSFTQDPRLGFSEAPYPNHIASPQNPGYPQPTSQPTSQQYYPQPPQNSHPAHNHPNVPHQHGQANPNNAQPPSIYPNLNHSVPFSYTQSTPNMPRSTSDFMRKGTPTVLPSENFDAQVDAATLRKAMKGFGCDEKALIEIICRRNNQQRQEIAKVFKTNFGKDLIENIQSETRGNFESLLVALLTPTLDFYCKEIKDALSGIGTDEDVLIEILCTLSNFEINTIKQHYQKRYGKDLESEIIGDTSGNFKRLLVSLCCANRDESGVTDVDQAKADATALLRAGELMSGTDESVFNSVLCQRNYEQLKLIFREYETMTGHSFEKALENEFSGDVKDGFTAIFRCVNNKAEFFAHQLMKSMKGLGTNDRQLIRLVVTRCEIDMTEIKGAFERLFGETLKECIKGDTSGDYKYGLYALIGEQRSS